MTMNLYRHLLDANLWVAAERIGDIPETSSEAAAMQQGDSESQIGR
jgi:hypothetical protein